MPPALTRRKFPTRPELVAVTLGAGADVMPALLTPVVRSEPAVRVLIIDTGALAKLSNNVDMLVRGSYESCNFILIVHDVTPQSA